MVRHCGILVVLALIVSGAAMWGLTRIPTGFIPIDDQGYLLVAVNLPDAASLGRTQASLAQVTKVSLSTPGVDHAIAIAGVSLLDNNADVANAGAVYVVLKPWSERGKAPGQDLLSIYKRISDALMSMPDGRAFVLPPPPIQGIGNAGGFDMQLELLGGSFNYQKLNEVAQRMVNAANADPRLQRVVTTMSAGAPHVAVTVDRVRAETLRVPVGDVFNALTDYVGSTYVNQFNKFGLSLQVYVQADSQFRLKPDDLLNLNVRSQDGNMIPIGAIAHLSPVVGPPLVTLYNLYPSATIIGAPGKGYSSGDSLKAMTEIAQRVLPPDVGYEWTAMSYQENVTGNQLYYVFALSILLVYLCLAGQYESWILPFAVLAAVPLALVGPVTALLGLGVANNLYVQIGLTLLIALSAKNGILIVEVAREHRLVLGKSIIDAAVEASRMRLRPILMTSFAFILGVTPLVLATGAGANARRSLGITVFSGMIASTCLAVLFVPSFFVLLQTFAERGKKPVVAAPHSESAGV
jgi:HAE1 family hydrophobic/amphiphilic exporter-1